MSALSVLLVTDEVETATIVERALSAWRDDVTIAGTAGAAMDARRSFDAAIIDVDIQKGAGMALLHFFRARDPALALIALARAGDAESEVVAHALGASFTVPKPITGDDLLVALNPVRERKAERADTVTRQSMLPLAPVLQAHDARSLATALAETARSLTGDSTRVVLDDFRDGQVEVRAGFGDPQVPVVLAALDETIGTLFLSSPLENNHAQEIDLLALSAATVGVFQRRLDGIARVGIKDPETSAYTFAYFVDVAGREMERARRHGRRFALLTFLVDNYAELRGKVSSDSLREARRELVDTILDTVRDTDIVAHVEDDELYVLVPEAGMLGALACRRRVGEKQRKRGELARLEGRPALQVTTGVATFPRDGRDLTTLLKTAHKRNSAARTNVASAILRDLHGGLEGLLGGLLRFRPDERAWHVRQAALAAEVLAAIGSAIAVEAARPAGGIREGQLYVVGDRSHPLVRGVFEGMPVSGPSMASYWLRPRAPGEQREESIASGTRSHLIEIEVESLRIGPFALIVALTEGWAYACVASEHGAYKRVMHTCEFEVAETLLAELQTTFHLQRGME